VAGIEDKGLCFGEIVSVPDPTMLDHLDFWPSRSRLSVLGVEQPFLDREKQHNAEVSDHIRLSFQHLRLVPIIF
jgi:hypothetical protein